MDLDYPAAHSMDSCWFAVDRDGHVGFFETGEAGAQPTCGLVAREAETVRQRLARAIPMGDYTVDLRGRQLPFLKGGGIQHTMGGSEWPVIMFLDSLDPVRAELEAGLVSPVRARAGYAVWRPNLSDFDYERLHRRGAHVCRGCFWQMDEAVAGEDDRRPNLARHGIYVYAALGGNMTANPYGAQLLPADPVHVDQLPPDLRAQVKKVHFDDLSFADTPVFQPAEHVPCAGHEPTYTDLTGQSHPLRLWTG